MKAITSFAAWSICIAGTLVLSSPAQGGLPTGRPAEGSESAARGQSPGTVEDLTPKEMLQAARDAMERQEWVDAEAYILRAEKRWPLVHAPWGDSPKAAKRDLEKLRGGGAPQMPSKKARPSLLAPLMGGGSKEARDPFAGGSTNVEQALDNKKPDAVRMLNQGRAAMQQGDLATAAYYAGLAAERGATFGAGEDSPARLQEEIQARGGRVAAAAGPRQAVNPANLSVAEDGIRALPEHSAGAYDVSPPPAGPAAHAGNRNVVNRDVGNSDAGNRDVGNRGKSLLLGARRAVAAGDTQRAMQMAAEARALGVVGGALEDSPAKIEALVRRHNEVMQRRAGREANEAVNKLQAQFLLEQAEGLLQCNDVETAERLAADAMRLNAQFGAFENNPATVLKRVAAARGIVAAAHGIDPQRVGADFEFNIRGGKAGVSAKAGLTAAPAAKSQLDRYAERSAGYDRQPTAPGRDVAVALHDQRRDGSYNVAAAAEEPERAPPPPPENQPAPRESGGDQPDPMDVKPMGPGFSPPAQSPQVTEWLRQGDAAMAQGNRKTAMEFYSRVMARREQLDPGLVQQVQEKMQFAQAGATAAALAAPPAPVAGAGDGGLLDDANPQLKLRRQVGAQLSLEIRKSSEMLQRDPRGALNQLNAARAVVEQSALSGPEKKPLLDRVGRAIKDTEKYVEQHRSEIELTEQNASVQGDVDRRRNTKLQVQQKLAAMVDEFNNLRDERRFEEAETKAKQAMEMAPDEPVTKLMWREVRLWRANANNDEISDAQNRGNLDAWTEVERAGIPMDEARPMQFPEVDEWRGLVDRRRRFSGDRDRRRNPKEIEIDRKLRSYISVKFREMPLSEVVERLREMTGINIYLDQQGLAAEGVHATTPVTLDLPHDIMLKSALNVILEPLHLGYVVRDEMLKITSEQHRSGNVYTKVYNVADLVIPIPDFVPHNRMGLPQMINDAYDRTMANLYGASGFQAPLPPAAPDARVTDRRVHPNGVAPANVLGQATGGGITTGGNRGGTASADFDGLIELITKTIEPESWDEVGGPGSMKPSTSNLSLVITQTQDVHERIADLLDQLRRLQDLQVTIEVRFITLSDNFFERIGVDFDFNIRDNATAADVLRANTGQRMRPSATLGLLPGTDDNPSPNFTSNGEIPFSQNSLDSAIPPFGGFNPASAATFGIAILSDLEAFFLVQAAQGDARTNIMQAPKVTLFNGQAASISDQSQTPFVTSVTPVVGDFAAAQAPVIVVLNEGTTLSVQAVVSQDRRFVRLTLIPFFSQIKDVKEFQFTGSTTTKSSASESSQDMGDNTSDSEALETTREGTTIQLPTFVFTTVTTTVSVPDGGTVLLGGIKRLREGRNEFGVPIMSKIPYVNRLFKNVGIGREAQSLMLMVTPRIIIQEEEEEKLGLAIPEEAARMRGTEIR